MVSALAELASIGLALWQRMEVSGPVGPQVNAAGTSSDAARCSPSSAIA